MATVLTVQPGQEAAALTWAQAQAAIPTSGVLYFPADAAATYDLTGWTVPDYISLKGDGRYSRIKGRVRFASVDTSFTRGEVSGLTFENGIEMWKAREFLFRNCRFEDSVRFDPDNFSHYNTFLHCTWDKVQKAIDCPGRNHFNKLISCRVSHYGVGASNPAIHIYKDAGGIVAGTWGFVNVSVEGHWSLPGPFGPAFDVDGLGHSGSGIYIEIQSPKTHDGGPVIVRGDGCDFHFGRISSGNGEDVQNLGNNNKFSGRWFNHTLSKYTHEENHGTIQLTPDVNGDAVIVHNVRGIPSYISVDVLGNAAIKSTVQGVDNRNITVRLVDISGAAVTLGSHNVLWTAKV